MLRLVAPGIRQSVSLMAFLPVCGRIDAANAATGFDAGQSGSALALTLDFPRHAVRGDRMSSNSRPFSRPIAGPPICRGCHPRGGGPDHVLGHRGFHGRRRHRRPAGVAAAQLRQRVPHLRPPAAAAHVGGDLRLRRHGADRHRLPCRAAHLPRPAVRRRAARLVRAAGLPVLHRDRRHRLPAGHHPEQGIRRARMVRRPVAHRSSGSPT